MKNIDEKLINFIIDDDIDLSEKRRFFKNYIYSFFSDEEKKSIRMTMSSSYIRILFFNDISSKFHIFCRNTKDYKNVSLFINRFHSIFITRARNIFDNNNIHEQVNKIINDKINLYLIKEEYDEFKKVDDLAKLVNKISYKLRVCKSKKENYIVNKMADYLSINREVVKKHINNIISNCESHFDF